MTGECVPGDLLILSPALGWAPGTFGESPDLEDLHAAILEDCAESPGLRRVLGSLCDGKLLLLLLLLSLYDSM